MDDSSRTRRIARTVAVLRLPFYSVGFGAWFLTVATSCYHERTPFLVALVLVCGISVLERAARKFPLRPVPCSQRVAFGFALGLTALLLASLIRKVVVDARDYPQWVEGASLLVGPKWGITERVRDFGGLEVALAFAVGTLVASWTPRSVAARLQPTWAVAITAVWTVFSL